MSCSCHINPPCSYCTSLTEEEYNAFSQGGEDAVEKLRAQQEDQQYHIEYFARGEWHRFTHRPYPDKKSADEAKKILERDYDAVPLDVRLIPITPFDDAKDRIRSAGVENPKSVINKLLSVLTEEQIKQLEAA